MAVTGAYERFVIKRKGKKIVMRVYCQLDGNHYAFICPRCGHEGIIITPGGERKQGYHCSGCNSRFYAGLRRREKRLVLWYE